jgi:hypothetical protein
MISPKNYHSLWLKIVIMDNSMMIRMMFVMMSTMMSMSMMSMMMMMLLCRLSIKAVNDRNESLRRRLYDGNYCYLCVDVCLISDKCAYCTNTLPSTVKLLVTAIS